MKDTKKIIDVDLDIKVVHQLPFNPAPSAVDAELIARARAAARSAHSEETHAACLALAAGKARAEVTKADRRLIVLPEGIQASDPDCGIYVPRVKPVILPGVRENAIRRFAPADLKRPSLIPDLDHV